MLEAASSWSVHIRGVAARCTAGLRRGLLCGLLSWLRECALELLPLAVGRTPSWHRCDVPRLLGGTFRRRSTPSPSRGHRAARSSSAS
eukprot:3831407-Alexandrium_andersonii.AAC.1